MGPSHRLQAAVALLALMGSSGTAAAQGTAGAPAGQVVGLAGDVRRTTADGTGAALARYDMVSLGDTIETGARGQARLLLEDESVVTVGPGTSLKVADLVVEGPVRRGALEIARGFLRVVVGKLFGGDSSYEIWTPTAVAGVRGTVFYLETTADGSTGVYALSGRVSVTSLGGTGKSVILSPMQRSLVPRGGDPLAPVDFSLDRLRSLERRARVAMLPDRLPGVIRGALPEVEPPDPEVVRQAIEAAAREQKHEQEARAGQPLEAAGEVDWAPPTTPEIRQQAENVRVRVRLSGGV